MTKRNMQSMKGNSCFKQLLSVAGLSVVIVLCSGTQTYANTFDGQIKTSAQQTQNIFFKGKILDEKGEPLVGVTVLEEKTKTGVVTDINGNFSISVKKGAILTISYIGYKSQTIVYNNQKTITVNLEPETSSLDEVVVVGYGSVKKRDLTGAVSSVKSDIVKMTPSSNPMEALQGRVAGLDITKSSGQAGTGITMQLRGNRSITASGNPLFIIDGMPGDYETLNPNDIESIEVLKDASSTAIYGSSGSNGVVIITTKKGEEGKLNVNFNAYLGFNGWAELPEMNNAQDYIYTQLLAKKEAGVLEDEDTFEQQVYEQALAKGEIVDWADALLKQGSTQNYSLSISGGTKKTQAYFSLNYSNEKGQYENDDYKLFSSTIRVNHNVNKWLASGLHVQTSYSKQEQQWSKLSTVLRADPFGKLYKDDGSINEFPINGDDKVVNLLLNNDKSAYRNNPNKFKMYFQPYIRITPIKGMTFESRMSASINYSTTNKFVGYGSYQFYSNAGSAAVGADQSKFAGYTSASVKNSRSWGYSWENILTYNFKLGSDHDFTFTGVTTYSDSESEESGIETTGITSNTYRWTNLGAATGDPVVSSGYSMGKSMGLVARLNYSFLGRYLFSASVRRDANSKLAEDVRWNTFPAFSLGWRISDEEFMAFSRDWLNNLKLRVGYGETGAAGINAYDSWAILQQGNMSLGSDRLTSYYFPEKLSNNQLTWERSKSTNIGLDASFLNNRIELTADYYITKTDGVIWNQNIPTTNGGYNASTAFTMTKNIAETENKGLELTLNTRNVQTKDFKWNSTVTFSKNNEEVTSLGTNAAEFITNGDYTLHVGDPIKSYRAYDIAGVWQYGQEADAAVFKKQPGDLRVNVPNMRKVSDGVWEKSFKQEDGTWATNTYDATTTYSVNANDKTIIGHQTPDWSLGFQNTFTYKNFDLSIYMYWRHGQMFYYDPMTWFNSSGGAFPSNFNYWTSTNPSNDFPALNSTRNWKNDEYYTSRAYVDGSFFKIKNITLGYNLPQQVLQRFGLTNLRVYGTITNPLVKASSHFLKNYDPEMAGSLDFPLTKQLVFGFNLSF